MRLSQLRFVQGNPVAGDRTIKGLDQEESLVYMDDEDIPVKARLQRGLRITVNLEGSEPGEMIAYKANRYAPAIELGKLSLYATEECWQVRRQNASTRFILESGDFYILASSE